MKRFRTILALILTLSLAASIIAITTAETVPEELWQADLRALMDDSSVPRSTRSSSGSSSSEEARRKRPNGVSRSASVPGPVRIDRNLKRRNGLPPRPARSCTKKTGDPSATRTAHATSAMSSSHESH